MAIAHFIGGTRANEIVEFDNKIDFPTDGYRIKSRTVELPHTGLFLDNDHVFFVANEVSQDINRIQEMSKIHWKLYEASYT